MFDCHIFANSSGIYINQINMNDGHNEITEITNEAIQAVRDYFYNNAKMIKEPIWGYEWDTKDGRIIELIVKIRNKDKENNNE